MEHNSDLELGEIPNETSWAETQNKLAFGKTALDYERKIARFEELLRENPETISFLQGVGAIGDAIRRRYLINVGMRRLDRHPFNWKGVEMGNDAAHAPRPFEDAIVCLQLHTGKAPLVSESATYEAFYGVSPEDAHSWRHIREVGPVLTMRCELNLVAQRGVRCSAMFDGLFHWFISNAKEIAIIEARLMAPDDGEDNVNDALGIRRLLKFMRNICKEIEREFGNILE